MDLLITALRNLLNTSNPADYRVKSVTGPDGTTTVYATYDDLLNAYLKAVQVNAQTDKTAYRPVRIGRGDRGGNW